MKEFRIGLPTAPLGQALAEEALQLLQKAGHNATYIISRTNFERFRACEAALIRKEIDCAIFPIKDVPALLASEVAFGAILPRGDSREVFVRFADQKFSELPRQTEIAVCSRRRRAQLRRLRPDIQFTTNIVQPNLAGTFLSFAGLKISRYAHHMVDVLEHDKMLPALGQGAIGVLCQKADTETRSLVAPLHNKQATNAVICERAFQSAWGWQENWVIAGHALAIGTDLHLTVQALSQDGAKSFIYSTEGKVRESVEMGLAACDQIKFQIQNEGPLT